MKTSLDSLATHGHRASLRCIDLGGVALLLILLVSAVDGRAQINTGSDGHDGALSPNTDIVINMSDHPDGIFHYTEVRIPPSVKVTFTPNLGNTPVTWLVQGDCIIAGTVSVAGGDGHGGMGGEAGIGGFRGGNGGLTGGGGQGPGGGAAGERSGYLAQYADAFADAPASYGNQFLIPLIGGSGGGGALQNAQGGGGGGGAILIAATRQIELNGAILACGGYGAWTRDSSGTWYNGGSGSGGAIRLVTSRLVGHGMIHCGCCTIGQGTLGRVRLDLFENLFNGTIYGRVTQGFQPVIIPIGDQNALLTVVSVGGIPIPGLPLGALATPDAVLSAQQNNPIPIVVRCVNIPLNTVITVTVKPMNASPISAIGYNTTGTFAESTAKVLVNLPRGGGLIYATAALSKGTAH